MAVNPVPEGYQSVTPYLTVEGADRLLAFLRQAFGAHQTERLNRPDGTVAHAEVRIGDSVIMLSETIGDAPPAPGAFYLYAENCDGLYHKALQSGGASLMEPRDEFYGDRVAGVRDPSGNAWWIATRREELSSDELTRRSHEVFQGAGI